MDDKIQLEDFDVTRTTTTDESTQEITEIEAEDSSDYQYSVSLRREIHIDGRDQPVVVTEAFRYNHQSDAEPETAEQICTYSETPYSGETKRSRHNFTEADCTFDETFEAFAEWACEMALLAPKVELQDLEQHGWTGGVWLTIGEPLNCIDKPQQVAVTLDDKCYCAPAELVGTLEPYEQGKTRDVDITSLPDELYDRIQLQVVPLNVEEEAAQLSTETVYSEREAAVVLLQRFPDGGREWIAEQLDISPNTVDNHRQNAQQRYNLAEETVNRHLNPR